MSRHARSLALSMPGRRSVSTVAALGSLAALLAVGVPATSAPGAGRASTTVAVPVSVRRLPADTRQAVRVVASDRWCREVYCAQLEAWERGPDEQWRRARIDGGEEAVRAVVGPHGFGKQRAGDGRTPLGTYRIVTTFSTDATRSGIRMPWRRRTPTTVVSDVPGPLYNTWYEERGRRNGARPAMRYGFWISWNNPRLTPRRGPAPVPGKGSGIFLHSPPAKDPWHPTQGCVQVTTSDAGWLVRWLDPRARPRVVLGE